MESFEDETGPLDMTSWEPVVLSNTLQLRSKERRRKPGMRIEIRIWRYASRCRSCRIRSYSSSRIRTWHVSFAQSERGSTNPVSARCAATSWYAEVLVSSTRLCDHQFLLLTPSRRLQGGDNYVAVQPWLEEIVLHCLRCKRRKAIRLKVRTLH